MYVYNTIYMYICMYVYITIIKRRLTENQERGLRNKAQRIFKKGNSHTTVY